MVGLVVSQAHLASHFGLGNGFKNFHVLIRRQMYFGLGFGWLYQRRMVKGGPEPRYVNEFIVVWSVKIAASLGHFVGRECTQMERPTMDERYIDSNAAALLLRKLRWHHCRFHAGDFFFFCVFGLFVIHVCFIR